MNLIKDARMTCPLCGCPDLRKAKIKDENKIEISGKLCTICSWHG